MVCPGLFIVEDRKAIAFKSYRVICEVFDGSDRIAVNPKGSGWIIRILPPNSLDTIEQGGLLRRESYFIAARAARAEQERDRNR
jgi:hypothetical protein